jgi:predicted RNA-binding protein with PUA-like domain
MKKAQVLLLMLFHQIVRVYPYCSQRAAAVLFSLTTSKNNNSNNNNMSKRPHSTLQGHADDDDYVDNAITSLRTQSNAPTQYFLIKSEPDEYSITNMQDDKTEEWDGIRNYQARNLLRSMKVDDRCFFYHSKAKPALTGIVGTVRVARVAQPDLSACNPKSEYYDPKCTKETNKWSSVLVEYEQTFPVVLTLKEIKEEAANDPDGLISNLALLKQSRLSVVPLTREQWDKVMRMIEVKVGSTEATMVDDDDIVVKKQRKKK